MVIGRVYRITSSEGNECHIVYTFDKLNYRFKKHKYNYNAWKKWKK